MGDRQLQYRPIRLKHTMGSEGHVLRRLSWYQRRLRAMSVDELVQRSHRSFVHLTDGVISKTAPRRWKATWEPDLEEIFCTRLPRKPIGFMQPDRGADLRTRFPEATDALVARAERAVARRVGFFGYPEVTVHGVGDDVDPFTGHRWPNRHAKRIDYRRSDVGDPKWIWELHRCQDLSVLAAAWLTAGDERYGRASAGRLVAWIRAHPPLLGMAWSSGFEAGIRAISFALTIDALRGRAAFLGDEELDLALASLWQHGRWITRDPSVGSSANNHRIGELAGLVVIGCLAPELRHAPRWLDFGLENLSREASLQIRADGTSVEQAFSYHLFVVDLLLLTVASLDATGHSVPEELTSSIMRSGDALWAQLGKDEPAPSYGDTDDGRAFVLDGSDLREPRGVAASIAARFGHAGAKRAAQVLDPTAWWLFGAKGVEHFEHTSPAPWPGTLTLPDGGLTLFRDGRRRVAFDHGPHGYGSLAAHAHADALRVDVSLGGDELIVDPGVGSYFARPTLRDAFRGTGFHATVSVDGLDSSVSGGPFLWSRHARSRLLALDLDRGFVAAEHDGYKRLGDAVTHRRAVVALLNGSFLVVDRLAATGMHQYSQRWPLHPALEVETCSAEGVVARRPGSGVLLSVAGESISVSATRGQTEPSVGWWSERLESVAPSWLVSVDVETSGPLELATLVVPFETDAPEMRLETSATSNGVLIEALGTRWQQTIEVDLSSTPVRVQR
jgi:uncharacterized heparinase superfamily protein